MLPVNGGLRSLVLAKPVFDGPILFMQKNAVSAITLKVFTTLLWRGYMQVCMDQTRKLITVGG